MRVDLRETGCWWIRRRGRRRRRREAILAILALFRFMATAQENPSLLYGTVDSVDAAAGKVVITPKGGSPVTVTADANTKV